MDRLPRPTSSTDMYLAAILNELRALRAAMAPAPAEPPAEEVELREPVKPKRSSRKAK